MIAPTIIIGLGGIGSDICCRVSKQVRNDEQRKRIRFVCIDTDINDLARRREESPSIVTIQTSAPYTVGDYIKKNTNAKDNWFPVHNILMGKTPTEGAGQVRAISRLAFEQAVREGRMTALDKAIEELYFLDGEAQPQAVRIMIVSTLAGGTGSGIVLPVALYVRHFLETRFRKNASVVRGFFLLPEIMFGNKSPEECGSLCCNAYASIRELDAFMRRGDGALTGPKYKDLKLELFDPSAGCYVDYQVSPFNFCFLYDKRNSDDLQLRSFDDYKEHAANTLYAQAISGMNSRSNSNEDNVIKPLVESNGRNRFCGVGSSLLKYPRDSVLKYVADKWCIQNMDEEWMSVDKAYLKYLNDQEILRKKNPSIKDIPIDEFYVEHIEHAEKGSFEESIFNMCHTVGINNNAEIVHHSKVSAYMKALGDYVKSQLENEPELIGLDTNYNSKKSALDSFVHGNKGEGDSYNQIADDVEEAYHDLADSALEYMFGANRIAASLGRNLAMQLFQDERDHTDDDSIYRIEHYMHDGGKFIHPNATRYFIYALTQKFEEHLQNANKNIEKLQDSIDPDFNTDTDDKDSLHEAIKQKIKKKNFFHRNQADREEILASTESQHEAIGSYAYNIALKMIYEAGIHFLNDMSDTFEKFYSNFSSYLLNTYNEVAEIERKYINGEGKATRYVCASKKCLEGMMEKMKCEGDDRNVNGVLSATIYQEIKTYSMMVKKPNPSIYFFDLFNDKIVGFWSKRVYDKHKLLIDMNIIDALEAEAEFESKQIPTQDEKTAYVNKVLAEAYKLSAPFIEAPMGESRHVTDICAYNPSVEGLPDSTRRNFVHKSINDVFGGESDENVSPYELMFYRAIYDLSAGDLMRFRAPEGKNTRGGQYYAAYIDTIHRLGTDTKTNTVLTPHLDKHWHLPKYLPDLDDRNQSILENEIYTALTWGMITGLIEQNISRDSDSHRVKKLVSYRPQGLPSDEFIVSNGTACDELYEVVDALAINLPQVKLILDNYRKTMDRERTEGLALNQSLLMRSLSWIDERSAFGDQFEEEEQLSSYITDSDEKFVIKQYATKQNASIFDLIYWIKISTPADDFEKEELGIMLDSMFTMLETYVERFTGKLHTYERCYNILIDQFTQFLRNLVDSEISRPQNRLKDECVRMIRDRLSIRIEDVYKMDSRKCGVINLLYKQAEAAQNNSETE